jgi:hypothetical protein
MSKVPLRRILLCLCLATVIGGTGVVIVSCTKTVTNPGGDLFGPQDMHCIDPATGTMTTQQTDPAGCQAVPDAGVEPDAAVPAPEFGTTMFNKTGFDDDCKYGISWTSTSVLENTDVFFTVVATTTVDNKPATGANIFAEVFLDDMHEAPPTNQTAVESPPGTYKVGPIRFDQAGAWTVRFHLFETCKDLVDDSPHGHAAFFVDVP